MVLVFACVGFVLTLPVGSVGQARASDPGVYLSVATGDTLMLPDLGRISGVTWVGVDTVAVLTDIPDSLTESGDREVRLVFQNPLGEVLRVEDFTGVLDRGLAWDGEFLWSCGDAPDGSSILYKIEPDTLMVEEAYDAPGHRPSGLCWDGRFIWITDRDSGHLDRFDPETEEISRTVIAPGFSPFSVAWDGRYMWLTDSGSGRMYRLAGGRRQWSATVNAEEFLFRGRDVLVFFDGLGLRFVPPGENFAVELLFE